MFKCDKRRTLYSFGKVNDEKHRSHKRSDGVVGLMCQINQKDKNLSILNDYDNKLAFKYHHCRGNNTEAIRIGFTDERLQKDEDTKIIIAVPIWKEETLVGAVTFDFADVPSEYSQRILEYEGIDENSKTEDEVLKSIFDRAEECRDLIESLIGNTFDDGIKRFYEESW